MTRIDLVGAINARDLGGMKCPYGMVKQGKLLRSGELSRLTDADVAMLSSIPLGRVVDLRTDAEIANSPDVLPNGTGYTHIPIISATTFGITYEKSSPEQIALLLKAGIDRMKARGENSIMHLAIMYRKFVNDEFSRKGYGKFLKLLATPTKGATLWHCTVGKDRCGTCTALLLECLGVDKEQIYADYLLTNEQTQAHKIMILDKVRDFVSPDDLVLIDTMRSVTAEYLAAFYAEIDDKFGNVDNFLAACGVTETDKENLRKLYLQQ